MGVCNLYVPLGCDTVAAACCKEGEISKPVAAQVYTAARFDSIGLMDMPVRYNKYTSKFQSDALNTGMYVGLRVLR